MTSKKFHKATIEYISDNNYSEEMLGELLNFFEYAIKRMGLARKAWFELKDFQTAEKKGLENFSMFIERKNINGQEQYWGEFDNNENEKLEVIGTLEG